MMRGWFTVLVLLLFLPTFGQEGAQPERKRDAGFTFNIGPSFIATRGVTIPLIDEVRIPRKTALHLNVNTFAVLREHHKLYLGVALQSAIWRDELPEGEQFRKYFEERYEGFFVPDELRGGGTTFNQFYAGYGYVLEKGIFQLTPGVTFGATAADFPKRQFTMKAEGSNNFKQLEFEATSRYGLLGGATVDAHVQLIETESNRIFLGVHSGLMLGRYRVDARVSETDYVLPVTNITNSVRVNELATFWDMSLSVSFRFGNASMHSNQ